MTGDADTLTLLERALEQTAAILAGISGGQAGLATPCPGWNVRALVRSQHLSSGVVALGEQAQQKVLGADVVVPELHRLPQRPLQHLLGRRREREAARGRVLATAGDLLDPVPRFLQRDAQRLQRQGGDALSLGEQAEQEALGSIRAR